MPRFAADEDRLAVAVAGPSPTPIQHREFLIAADEIGQDPRPHGFETAGHPARAQNPPRPDGVRVPFESLLAQVLALEQAAGKALCRSPDGNGVRRRKGLQPGGQIRSIADHRCLLGGSATDQVADHHCARGNADAHREAAANCLFDVELVDRIDDREAGVDRPFGVVLVHLGKPEIGQDTVAEIAGDESVVTGNQIGTGVLVDADDVTHVLGIEDVGDRSRIDQIAEQNGQLSPFRFAGYGHAVPRPGSSRRRRRLRQGAAATAAKLGAGPVGAAARGTGHGQRRAAGIAELVIVWVLGRAGGTLHRHSFVG